MYIHKLSNHPPSIIKNLPASISRRIADISCDEETFNEASPAYNDALKASEFAETLTYTKERPTRRKQNRKRNIIWFNPPFSKNVTTNIGRSFLRLVDKHFPKKSKFNKIFNRNTLKVSYSCMPNVASIIKAHNKQVSSTDDHTKPKTCNCRKKNVCPLQGNCQAGSIIYSAKVSGPESPKQYIGLTEPPFKLSTPFTIEWSISSKAQAYSSETKKCNLCLTEKLAIINAEKQTLLNKRPELISKYFRPWPKNSQVICESDRIQRLRNNLGVNNPRDEVQHSSHGIRTPQLWTRPNENELEKALVLGSRRNLSNFLTIGLPTVLRETDNYLSQTLDSLILNSSPEERSAAILLIFLADFEDEKRSILRDMIKDKYLPYLESGFIQVIQAPASFYPSLKNLKSNYGDSETRVRWRSKQCVDIAYTFIYGSGLSEYYLHMEDDVITVKGYITAIRTYIREKSNVKWVILEFASLGTFGQLLRAYDLDRLAQFILFFYQDQPVDWLFSKFKDLNAQQKKYIRKPSIFQHKGIQSSLKGKNMAHWVDKTFIDTNKASGKNQSSGKV
ncbi:alpha-1,3-mannosyl-glycoprotein 4-beta-N-acetylglucosaminyltransferase B-like [Strongylocentrotus purpuratus]|uniref:MGAT4 conserved region domain-containing protein n=1 Tax=Strongylocentrotus purpuratus TaxID=7668 RepID=A0A7M7STY9_STRPU|nr:alpha-1,3-mannosyl-glycoprotein 4-beta-N-acetylglucosaminyltransferase B-like [Strongylocentrotus purpuratus]